MNLAKKYYDVVYFRSIMHMAEKFEIHRALTEFQKYIEKYPTDVSGKTYYADTLIKAGNIEEAEEVLNSTENLIETKTPIKSIENIILIKMQLLTLQGKYKEAYDTIEKNLNVFYRRGWHFDPLLIYLRKKLNILTHQDYACWGRGYLIDQVLSYTDERAFEHIKKHQDTLLEEPLQFVPSFPLEEVFQKMKEMLPLEPRFIPNGFQNAYIFKYNANGHVYDKLVDYFQVRTFHDTNEIITMYPFENQGKEEYIDITPEEEIYSLKHQRVSQIDKFNARYGKNNK